MKATGIVRRIDDLGRVILPKEVRRMMHIKEGDPLEIFTTTDREIVLRKYSSMNTIDWNIVKTSLIAFIPTDFAIYDENEKLVCDTSNFSAEIETTKASNEISCHNVLDDDNNILCTFCMYRCPICPSMIEGIKKFLYNTITEFRED